MPQFLFIILFLLSIRPVPALAIPAPAETKRVLVIYSQDRGLPANLLTDQGIQSVFRDNTAFKVELYAEYLDSDRFPGTAQTMAAFLKQKYEHLKMDAVITVLPPAADFIQREGAALFPGVPIIASEIIRSSAEALDRSPQRPRITGVIIGDNVAGVLDSALRLKPRTKRVALIGGISLLDKYGIKLFSENMTQYTGKLELIDLTKLPMEETLARVGTLPPDTIVFYSNITLDGAGRTFISREALSLVAQASNAPVFGLYDSYLGYGIVGGRLVSFLHQGKSAADLALRVMAGLAPGAIPFAGDNAYVDQYDWRELKRWGISKTEIPAGGELLYYVPPFWEKYRWTVVTTAGLIVVETLLIVGLIFNVRRRERAERSLGDSKEQLRLSIASAGAGIWGMGRDGRIIWATEPALEMFGFAGGEQMDLNKILRIIHPEDCSMVRTAIPRAFETGKDINVDYRLILPDGTPRWIAVRCKATQLKPKAEPVLMGVCIDITARKHAEESLKHNEQQLATLAGRLIYNQEEELRRLSRELHDDLTQRLAVLAIDAGMLEKNLHEQHPDTATELREIKECLIEVSNDVHHLSRQLHPTVLEDLGLVKAAQAECDAFRKRTGIDLSFSAEDSSPLSRDEALCLYRVMQEALQNMAKHAGTDKACVSIEALPDATRLTVKDFGIGFDQKGTVSSGIGLSSMKERARLVDGDLTIRSVPGEGTTIEISIPRRRMSHDQTENTLSR